MLDFGLRNNSIQQEHPENTAWRLQIFPVEIVREVLLGSLVSTEVAHAHLHNFIFQLREEEVDDLILLDW